MKRNNIKKSISILLLHVLMLVYSLSSVARKYTSQMEVFSVGFFVGYLIVFILLAVYAIGWQQVIKHMPLTEAYANKAVVIIWGLFWGAVLFGEQITPEKIIGAVLIICGIVLYAISDNEGERKEKG